MKYWSFKNWLTDFTFSWLSPKIAVALPAATLSAVIFSLDDNTNITDATAARLANIFKTTESNLFYCLILVSALILLISSVTRTWSQGKSRSFYLIASSAKLIAKPLNFLFGMMLVPLIVALTAIAMRQNIETKSLVISIAAYIFVYVLIGAAIHLLAESETYPFESIVYVVWTKGSVNHDIFNYRTSERFEEIMSHIPFFATPITSLQAAGGFANISVSSNLRANCWKKKEINALRIYLEAIQLEWRENEIHYSFDATPNLLKRLARSGFKCEMHRSNS